MSGGVLLPGRIQGVISGVWSFTCGRLGGQEWEWLQSSRAFQQSRSCDQHERAGGTFLVTSGNQRRSAATGYVQNSSGYVAGFFGEEPEDGVGDFVGLAAALHGDAGLDAIDTVGLACESVEFGVDVARADGVDANLLFGNFFGEAKGQCLDGAFGGGVVDVFVGGADAGGSRGNIDDAAALACRRNLQSIFNRATARTVCACLWAYYGLD